MRFFDNLGAVVSKLEKRNLSGPLREGFFFIPVQFRFPNNFLRAVDILKKMVNTHL